MVRSTEYLTFKVNIPKHRRHWECSWWSLKSELSLRWSISRGRVFEIVRAQEPRNQPPLPGEEVPSYSLPWYATPYGLDLILHYFIWDVVDESILWATCRMITCMTQFRPVDVMAICQCRCHAHWRIWWAH